MIHIGICDDDSVFRNHLKEEIEKYFTNTTQDICCHLFEDAEQLFAYDITSLQLLFLDIRLPGNPVWNLRRHCRQTTLLPHQLSYLSAVFPIMSLRRSIMHHSVFLEKNF